MLEKVLEKVERRIQVIIGLSPDTSPSSIME